MSATAPDLRDLLALHLLPGLGPRLTAALLQRFGSAGAALRAGAARLREVPRIYPPEHAGLADEVAAAGALITEAPMKQDPLAGMFPARNRIISGLSRGVIIVEAAEPSGTRITAGHAAEQGRTVFAVPGPID